MCGEVGRKEGWCGVAGQHRELRAGGACRERETVRRGMEGVWVRIPSVRRRIAYHVLREAGAEV